MIDHGEVVTVDQELTVVVVVLVTELVILGGVVGRLRWDTWKCRIRGLSSSKTLQ